MIEQKPSLEKSELNRLIPPEIKNDRFYKLIRSLSARAPLRYVLEIGSSSGGGSTAALVSGLEKNSGSPKLFCIEVSKVRFEALKNAYAGKAFVHCYNGSTVSVDEFPSHEAVSKFYQTIPTKLNNYPLSQVLGWLDQDIQYVAAAGVEAGAIEKIKSDHGIDTFDLVLIDGSEFTGSIEYEKVRGATYILLDDTNTFKCYNVRDELLHDPMYDVIADDQSLRNGYSAFKRREYPRQTIAKQNGFFSRLMSTFKRG